MTYNPFVIATKAAFTALTCDEAKEFYSVKAQADTQAVIDTALTVGIGIYQLCSFVYALGAAAGEWAADTVEASQDDAAGDSGNICYLPAPKAVAALPPAKDRRRNTVEAIAPLGVITPDFNVARTPIAGIASWVSDTGIPVTEPVMGNPVTAENYLKLSKKQLIDRCAARGLSPRKSMTKRVLADMLTASYAPVKPWQVSRNGKLYNIA